MAVKKKETVSTGELGGSGTTIYGGVVSGAEYNTSLSTDYGGNGLRVYDKMRRSDPMVRAALFIIKLAILQAEWTVTIDDKAAQGEELKNFYREALFERMDRSFFETLSDILTYLPFGFHVAEKVFKIEDNKVWWEKFAYRAQTSIKAFETKEKQKGVTQTVQGDRLLEEVSIPIEKLLIFTNEKEGDNWRGQSLLRSAYKPYFFKEQVEKIDAIGFEREAVGIPVFIMPQNPKPEDEQKADTIGENLRAHEKAYVKLPFGWEFDVKYPTGSRRDADVAIKRWNREILVSVLTQFLDLGSTDSGSRALSTDHTEVFYKSIQAIADYIAAVINQHGGRQLIDLNFDNVKTYPELRATGIEKIDLQKFGDALSKVVSSHVVQPDDELEDYIRKVFRLPERGTPRKDPMLELKQAELENGQPNGQPPNGKKPSDKKPEQKKGRQQQVGQRFSLFEPYRPLYFAEQKVNYPSLKRQIDRLEQEINREVPAILADEIDQLVTHARFAVQSGDTKRVDDLRIQFRDQVRTSVQDKLKQAYELGKVSASNEMDTDAPKTSDDVIDYLVTQANILADKLTQDLLNDAKLQVMAQIQQDAPAEAALAALRDELTDAMLAQTNLLANVTTVGGINQGRIDVFDADPTQVYALQRSEVLDTRICNYCISVDGRVIEKTDAFRNKTQFHFMCRGIWVAIGEAELEKPEIGGIPRELRRPAATVTDFEQLDAPQPLKNSLADEFVKDR
jgi:hypothetical protein